MLSANVLCLKKRKKKTYSLCVSSDKRHASSVKESRPNGGAVTMLQITEDTPPDMLAGAMDLTVHLPSGRSVKMAVERSTPMMDLLVQITTNHHLHLSNYTLQALGMAPSSEHSDKILLYKPNTPIGTLDTQHIKVIPKSRSIPVPKNIAPGHQPFESTFRLKVHLPRNQLYVTRVSRNVLLEDIMKKVCEEKNLDPLKYDFKHPGNLDEVLDPKLTLSDYQITEIYVVLKGTVSLNQAFSTSDIMALRKEEERKQMHNKTGGGVFNLIFRRGKSSVGSGSISSDTRSISPTHSDDSRSVTPPAVQQQIITPPKKESVSERPKPPQRKRRPAPKPPQTDEGSRKNSVEKPPSNISETENQVNELQSKRVENGLTICHSRNSSDSSGYHEASVLSENGNTSLPRRPKSAFVTGGDVERISKMHSQSTTNLSKMTNQSKSTTSLGIAGRKKKAAPPPPPAAHSSNSDIISEIPSPVVASQPITSKDESISTNLSTVDNLTSITSIQSNHLISEPSKIEEKSFDSTDSGISQDNIIEKQSEVDVIIPVTPPPPPDFVKETKADENIIPPPIVSEPIAVESFVESRVNDKSENNLTLSSEISPSVNQPTILSKREDQKRGLTEEVITKAELEKGGKEPEISDIDWQYQLPSPPKAFRDISPANFTDTENLETHSVTDFKDSVVTSPELFEKLKAIEDNRSEKDTINSDLASIVSEEEKPLLNKLSLEHLEKRKSLVYNRELATSLKMTDTIETKAFKVETFSSSLTQFESTYEEIKKSSLPKEISEPKYQKPNISSHTLPNFKISTYDCPKQKIKVFEDDTIRSNTDNKVSTVGETHNFLKNTMSRSYLGRSMENISFRKNSLDQESSHSNEEKDYKFYKPSRSVAPKSFGPVCSVFRSESFSVENSWSPSKPVSRSKSHLTLNMNKYREEKLDLKKQDSISRSNSLFDVSGLQSLEVMKLIQNKLSTPTSSVENIRQVEKISNTLKQPEKKPELFSKQISIEETQRPPVPVKTFRYRGPPSINMGTWSERPKVPVGIKEDADYKLGNTNVSSKLIVNTTNNNIISNNSLEIKNATPASRSQSLYGNGVNIKINGTDQHEKNNVSIKVNGSESISSNHNTGNVIIKIGSMSSENSKHIDNHKFISHTTAAGYRKPFSNVNKNQPTPRPHSIAFGSDFDISRVPVVRSVELKKPYKEVNNTNNTSVTQIYQGNNVKANTLNRTEPVSELRNKFSNLYRSSENLTNGTYSNSTDLSKDSKAVFRVKSFKPNIVPVVRGFKTMNDNAKITNRLSWNPPTSYSTLPAKPKETDNYPTNKQVPFSQLNLKRTESHIVGERNADIRENKPRSPVEINNEKNNTYNSLPTITKSDIINSPPPPPLMPKVNLRKPVSKPVEQNLDPRDELLAAIRNFGGKKGLRAVKAH